MNESVTEVQELTIDAEPTPEKLAEDVCSEPSRADEELREALAEANLKLALMLCGVAKSKLQEGERLAVGLVAAGASPEEAAESVAQAYPHLKLIEREVPTFAAATSGKSDSFAAIRGIFAKR